MSLRGRDSFKEYRYMKGAIDRLKKVDCTVSDVVRGSSTDAPYTEHSIRVRGTDQWLSLANNARIMQYTSECKEVEKLIQSAPVKMREMLTMHYVDGAPLSEVAVAFGYSTKNSAYIAIDRWFRRHKM